MVEALHCKSEGRGFDCQWCHWNFSWTYGPGVDSASNRNEYQEYFLWGTRWRSWLRHCTASRKVAGSIPDGVIGIFHGHMAPALTQPLTEMSTRDISCGGTRWRSWLSHCTASRKVAGSIADGVIGIFHGHMVPALTQPLTEMSTRNIYCGARGGAVG